MKSEWIIWGMSIHSDQLFVELITEWFILNSRTSVQTESEVPVIGGGASTSRWHQQWPVWQHAGLLPQLCGAGWTDETRRSAGRKALTEYLLHLSRSGVGLVCSFLPMLFCPITGGNAKPRIQAFSENCKDVPIFCQHNGSLLKSKQLLILWSIMPSILSVCWFFSFSALEYTQQLNLHPIIPPPLNRNSKVFWQSTAAAFTNSTSRWSGMSCMCWQGQINTAICFCGQHRLISA